MSRMPSSLVAPQTPAWVVTGAPSSRATSNAARSGNAGSPVTSKAIWNPSMSSPGVIRRLHEVPELRPASTTPRGRPGCCRTPARTGRAPTAARRPRRRRAADVCSPCDQSTVVVTPASSDSIADEQVAGVHVLGPEHLAVLEVVPDEVLGQRPVRAVAAHRGLPHVPVRVDHARQHDAAAARRSRRSPPARRATGRPPRSARRRPARRCPSRTVRRSSMGRTVPPRNATGRPDSNCAIDVLLDRRPERTDVRMTDSSDPRHHGPASRRPSSGRCRFRAVAENRPVRRADGRV